MNPCDLHTLTLCLSAFLEHCPCEEYRVSRAINDLCEAVLCVAAAYWTCCLRSVWLPLFLQFCACMRVRVRVFICLGVNPLGLTYISWVCLSHVVLCTIKAGGPSDGNRMARDEHGQGRDTPTSHEPPSPLLGVLNSSSYWLTLTPKSHLMESHGISWNVVGLKVLERESKLARYEGDEGSRTDGEVSVLCNQFIMKVIEKPRRT